MIVVNWTLKQLNQCLVNAISVIQRRIDRSSRRRFSIKKFSYKVFKFTGKHLFQSLFFKRFYYRFFPVNFSKFVGPLYLQNTIGRLLLHLEPCQISTIELFCGKSKSLTVSEKETHHICLRDF